MTVVNTATGELLDAPSYGEVKSSIERAKASLEEAAEQIVWQIENRAWSVLGYSDWNEMREAEYGGAAFMVPRAERPELVARMRRSGLTQQEIADTAGVGVGTVHRDLSGTHFPSGKSPETITNARGEQRPASYAPRPHAPQREAAPDSGPATPDRESREGASGTPRPAVTDIDDKTYTRPTPKPATDHATAEYENATQACLGLTRAMSRLLTFQHPNMRAGMRGYWSLASAEVPPGQRQDVTPEQMRVAARGLLELADEWESK